MYPKKTLLFLASIVVLCAPTALGQSVGSSAAQLPRSIAPVQNSSNGPRIWLQENQPLPVVHRDAATQSQVGMRGAQPLSMTSGDIDADGFEDLLVGYSTAGGGIIAIHRGNIDAFAPQSDASFQAIGRGEFPSPFQLEAQTLAVPVNPDFLALGDFIGAGNNDLAVASEGGQTLYIYPGNGKGGFGNPQTVSVTDPITALAAGQFGGSHVQVLVVAGARSLTIYTSLPQGLTQLASYSLTAAAANILFGNFGDPGPDIAFLSGGKIQIVRSANMQIATLALPVSVRAFALGSFLPDRNSTTHIALLAPDGNLQIAVRNEFDPRAYSVEELMAIRQARRQNQTPSIIPPLSFPVSGWRIVESFPGAAAIGANQTPVLFRTRVSNHSADDVMVLNGFSGQLVLVSHPDQQVGAQTFPAGQVSLRPYSGAPRAALPMRINVDGRPGVIALHQGEIAPSLIEPIPDPNFFVNTDNDPTPTSPIANACNNTSFSDTSSSCSLREAVLKANGDTIMLQAGHTYQLTIGRGATQDYSGNTGALYVNHSATFVGGNQNTTIIKWGTPSTGTVDMVMAVNQDIASFTTATGSLSNLTIQGGSNHGTVAGFDGDGGCMEFDTGGNNAAQATATLTLTNVTLQNCATNDGNGGGLANFNTNNGTGMATITNSIIQNNSVKQVTGGATGTGGGIWVSDPSRISLSSSQVLNNLATNTDNASHAGSGGGITITSNTSNSRQTQIHASTISGNQAAGLGGGINTTANLLVDTGSVISNNKGGTASVANLQNGGGIFMHTSKNGCPAACTDSVTLTKVTITGNTATGNGGGISNGDISGGTAPTAGPLTMSFSRLAGNTATGSGANIRNNGTAITATNNWWGTNDPASTINTVNSGTTNSDPFIVLTHTASPDKIRINQSSTLTGDMSKDNHGNGAALSGNLDEIVGLPITFDNPVLGTIPQAQPETLGNPVPTATATYNAGGTGGLGSANATVDQAVVPVDSNLIASATESGTTATITTVGAHNFIAGNIVHIAGVAVNGYNGTFSITSVNPPTQFSYTANASGLANSSGGSASIGLPVLQPPSITKTFSPTTVATNTPSTITFSIDNSVNAVPINASFTDTLPANLVVATTPTVVNNCGGTVTATAGSGTISFSNDLLAVGTCTIQVNVQSAVDNTYSNSVTIDSSDAGNGNTSSASVTVINPPHIVKAFGATTVPLNGTTSLTFTIDSNSNQNLTLNGVAFTDSLPAGLVVATPGNLSNNCGGTATAADGSSSVALSSATLAPNSSCTVSVKVQGTTGGAKNNSVTVSSTNGGTGNTSTASLTVVGPPSISKAFAASSIPLNGSTSLSFTINNSNSVALTGVGFTDTLPAGLIISTPNGLTGSCGGGTITATQNTNAISLSGATLAASSSCTFSVNVTGTAAGQQNNTSGAVTSTEGGTGNTASASITVVAPPSIAKAFNPASIALNATTSLTFTITNPPANTVALSGVAFTDTLPTGLTVASGTSTVCGGTLTTTAPTGIALSGATINANSQCQFSVTVTGAASGQYTNTSGNVTSTNGGTGNTASANLTVASPVSITKAFGATTIPLNGTTTLSFTISNPNNSPATGVAFTDSLPAGLVVAGTPNLSNTCGGTATAAAGSSTVSLSAGTIAASGSCAVSVKVTGTTTGTKNNSVTVSSTEGGTGNTSNASITVVAAPTIQKAFGAASIPLGGSTSLSFTINNPNSSTLTGVGFTDGLPAGLVISTPNGLTGSCGGGTITATQNTTTISLSGASLGASASCTFSVNVTGTTAGSKVNTTSNVTSTEGGTGGSATATIHVEAPPSIAKAFSPSGIAPSGVSTLTFTITNPAANADPQAGVAFTDTLPANVVVATPNGAFNNCGGTLTAVAGSGSISLTGGSIAVASSCTVSVNVTSVVPGTYNNTSGNVSSTNGGTGNTASATLTVAHASLAITKTHSGSFPRGSTGNNYTITVSNSANAGPTTGTVTVTDTLPSVSNTLVATALSGTGWTCNLGTLTCTRSDALAAGASYPAITLTVSVPIGIGGSTVTNSATVSGGGDPNSHTANDPTHITHP